MYADPSIFYATQAQNDGTFKAIASLYEKDGLDNLTPAPENNELLGMERILSNWMNLDQREPTLKIVCPAAKVDLGSPQYGAHNEGCANLLWELRRTRRQELTPTQLANKNPTEKICRPSEPLAGLPQIHDPRASGSRRGELAGARPGENRSAGCSRRSHFGECPLFADESRRRREQSTYTDWPLRQIGIASEGRETLCRGGHRGRAVLFSCQSQQATELGRIGGRSKRRVATESGDPLPTLDSAIAVRDTVARLIPDVLAGKVHPRIAASLGPLMNLQLHAIKTADFEKRLAKLEHQSKLRDDTFDKPSAERD
jgi:hypothetical protein